MEPVTGQAAEAAAELLKGAGLHGHGYAVDATVAEVALRQPKPVALLISESDDMTKLCGSQVRIIPLWPTGPPGVRNGRASGALAPPVPPPCPGERTTTVSRRPVPAVVRLLPA